MSDQLKQFTRSYVMYVLITCVAIFLYKDMAVGLIDVWNTKEEYSHGFFLPVIAGYFLWRNKEKFICTTSLAPSWVGVFIGFIALLLFVVGSIGFTPYLEKISLVLLIYGVFVARFGLRVTPLVFIPLVLIFLSYPLPVLVNAQFTADMQLISSQIGVLVIRFFDITVFLEGNVIDLGVYKLAVVEACSGLRYMYPLLSLSLILAYLFKVAMWKRAVLFISAIPITILMNSFRIGVIGVLVEHKGIGMAEGFLHDFEGWIIFMACFAMLFLEMWLLTLHERKSMRFSDLIERY